MEIKPQKHHTQAEFCYTRPPYRQGKEFKAVKVYTINDESQHLLIHNVPSIGLLSEVTALASKFGKLDAVELQKEYPATADFTHVFYVKYRSLRDARQAKKRLDNRSFFGNLLHVCYAPELESVEECKAKLNDRLNFIRKSYKSKSNISGKNKTEKVKPGSVVKRSEPGSWSHLVPSSSTVVIPKK